MKSHFVNYEYTLTIFSYAIQAEMLPYTKKRHNLVFGFMKTGNTAQRKLWMETQMETLTATAVQLLRVQVTLNGQSH